MHLVEGKSWVGVAGGFMVQHLSAKLPFIFPVHSAFACTDRPVHV